MSAGNGQHKQVEIHIPEPEGYRYTQLLFEDGQRVLNLDGEPAEWMKRIRDAVVTGEDLDGFDPMFQAPQFITRYGVGRIVAVSTAWMAQARPTHARGGRVVVPGPARLPSN